MQLHSIARNPVPTGAIPGQLETADGVRLRYARWPATRGPRRGTVVIAPGRGEFIEKYFEVVAELRRRGFAVAVMDWRGQGGSDRLLDHPRKGHVGDFSDYDSDLRLFMKEIVLPDCPPPYTGLGHSMGGAILMRNAIRPGSWFDRIVVTAPMIAFSAEKMTYPAALVRAYAELAALGFSRSFIPGGHETMPDQLRFEDNQLTSDRERWQRMTGVLEVAPELAIGSPTVGWVRAALRAMAELQEPDCPKRVQVPMLVFAAGADKIVDSRAAEDFAVQLKVGGLVRLPGSQHEILQENDPLRMRFWAAFDAYMGVEQRAA
ncbi:MAG: alpha/beta hydrolase [Hyphomicrobium sp.]|nr:alpha/beta hydrolase [Hyphomicrobium sp.]PPD08898.1 MAG: alpha/beta hydrolase [Hyphomicrobium sp.]